MEGTEVVTPTLKASAAIPGMKAWLDGALPKTLAGRFELLLDLYAPITEREDGSVTRDPAAGVISHDDFARLLEEL